MIVLPPIFDNTSSVLQYDSSCFSSTRLPRGGMAYFDFSLGNLPLVYSRLHELKQLKANWDGYGAEAPLPTVIERTYGFVDALANKYQKALGDQQIYPNPSGTITIDWERGERVVSLEIGASTANFFYSGEDYFKEEHIQNIDKMIPASLIKALMRLLSA
jgi:hypothetical protein